MASLRELLDAATPGPWKLSIWPNDKNPTEGWVDLPAAGYHGEVYSPDARLIALAPDLAQRVIDLEAALSLIAAQQKKTLETIKANNFVFTDIGAEAGNWQHLAFSIYTDLCEVDSIARAALEEASTDCSGAEPANSLQNEGLCRGEDSNLCSLPEHAQERFASDHSPANGVDR